MTQILERRPAASPPPALADHAAAPPRAPAPRWAIAGLSTAMLLASLGNSIANVALPTLATEFAAPFGAVQWVVLAYLLASTTLLVTVGRLGDLLGKRRLLLAGILTFTVAAGAAAAAPSLPLLIAARLGQGLGAATMVTLTMALIGAALPQARTGSAMGLLGTMSAIGTALGPSLGGGLIALGGWRTIFLLNVPLGIATFALVRRHVPAEAGPQRRARARLDGPGALLLALTLAAYAMAMTTWRGHADAAGAALLGAALAGLGLFIAWERRAASPLVQLAAFRDLQLTRGLVTNLLVSTVLMATLVVGPFYLAGALGLDAARVGLVMSAGPLVSALGGVPAGRFVDRVGTAGTRRFGLAGMVLGAAALAVMPPATGVVGYLLPLVVVTANYALFQAANNTAVMTGVAADRRGVVSALLNLARNLGLITGASFLGAVFAIAAGTNELQRAHAGQLTRGMHVTFAVATALLVIAFAVGDGDRRAAARLARGTAEARR